jgi:hypothetical protein
MDIKDISIILGIVTSFFVALYKFVVKPNLDRQYIQRHECDFSHRTQKDEINSLEYAVEDTRQRVMRLEVNVEWIKENLKEHKE